MGNTTERDKQLKKAISLFSQLSEEGQTFLIHYLEAVKNHDIQVLEKLKETAPDAAHLKIINDAIATVNSEVQA